MGDANLESTPVERVGEPFEDRTLFRNDTHDLLGVDCVINDVVPGNRGRSCGGREHSGEDPDGC